MSIAEKYFRLNPDSVAPLYQQIYTNLMELIDGDLLKAGDALPAERSLSDYYGVNRMTVRQAIDSLVQEGVIIKKQGAGTFVSDRRRIPSFTPTVVGFSQRIRESGASPSSRILERRLLTPDPVIAYQLQLVAEEHVIMLKRLRLVNDEPLMLETSYLSYTRFPLLMTQDLAGKSLYKCLTELYDTDIVEAEHTMEPTLPNAFEAEHLEVERDAPAMLVRVIAYTQDFVPIEFSKSIVRGDRCRYYFRVNTHKPIIT